MKTLREELRLWNVLAYDEQRKLAKQMDALLEECAGVIGKMPLTKQSGKLYLKLKQAGYGL